ncbi:MAG: hypothetical protein KJN90_09735 [Gammaproteobacteria bacterium]|nr:hypothetical protein [Gammaproteobacteria bacterium]
MDNLDLLDLIPDARDGLTRKQRIVLYCLQKTQQEFGDRNVPTITLYGRVIEHIDISQEEFQLLLNQLVGMTRSDTDM